MKTRFLIFFLAIILIVIYWQWLLPSPRVANDLPLSSTSTIKSFMDLPRLWTEKGAVGLGEYTVFTMWSYPVNLFNGILANLGVSFIILEKILLALILLLGSISIWKLCQYFNLSRLSGFIASFFYLTNTYVLLLIDGGQLSVALAYAWFPACYLLVEKSIKADLRRQIYAGIAIAILGYFDIRFIFVFFLLILGRFLYELIYLSYKDWLNWIFIWIKLTMVFALVVAGLHAFWLIPYYRVPISGAFFAQLVQNSFSSFTTLGHSFLLLSPNWYKNVFGHVTPLLYEFIPIPILVFLSAVLKPRDKIVGFWLLVCIITIFLTKGSAPPLQTLYPWFYSNIPGFSLFRDSTKFFLLVALSYSLLIAVSVDEIRKRIASRKIKIIFFFFLTCYLLFLVRPVWLGQMTGTFSEQPLQKEYLELANLLENDNNFSRVLWIPFAAPLTYSNNKHPILEAARLAQERTFAIGTLGTYEVFNFLREAPFVGELFDVSGIGYIVYPPLDARRDNLHPDNIKYYYTFLNQLSKLPWLSKIENSPIPFWKVNQHQEKFFVTPNLWWVIGSEDVYSEATKSAKLKLSKNAIVFAEKNPGLGVKVAEFPEAKIVLNNKTDLDLASSFLDPSSLIFPAEKMGFEPDKSGWWKRGASDLVRWRYFLQSKYGIDDLDFDLGGGWAVGEGEKQFTIYNLQFTKGKVLLARVMESSRSGELKFYQDDKLLGQVNTKGKENNVRWFEVGKLNSDNGLTIVTAGDINVINALAVLNEDSWMQNLKKVKDYHDQGRIFKFDEKNVEELSIGVIYQQINPTKYKVSINGLKGPAFLVFSESFDGLWKLNTRSSLPVYGFLNGFRVDRDGDYIIEFEPQKLIYPGLVITGLTAVSIFFLLIRGSKRLSSKL